MRKITASARSQHMVPKNCGLNPRRIREGLQTDFIGQELYYQAEVTSTNDLAKELAEKGSKEGTVVLSETQSQGRGRHGRRWESPAGGVWLSIILRPKIEPQEASKLTLTAGVAVARVLRETFDLKAEIKWPNDLLIHGRKVCGILTETSTTGEALDFVVVGLGVNSNVDLDSLPDTLRGSVTSLKEELKGEINQQEFLRALLEKLEQYYKLFIQMEFDSILEEWRRLATLLGRYVEITSLDEKIKGQVVDVDQNGALMIRLPDGSLKRFVSGEVTLQT
ncbi:biotin--[acetyl-CoA-carboxylase] ligase [Candidatus Bathyarchaeota archaeon]|nr:biotin--[acetyl-CoA-carboxylase] ligase [Candidatus Bathyarchaeota archaeon]NIU81728.1 biotin--[acetyl-CoA-carboxylase] ligase [Candidatus Bathyarchaeota archaeon]NIV68044.1 biotin--[acetyl-CoA-carboxylase] ligase [Candidatus Bathyarchaeota archaeon]NIW16453.1 biotin--[acetyl-CoA-carboxylase] ligase [Candidatus Bathyarchaeota archaeon]NIW34573.1 biotin--[acetyl-CoA-carboxylase] ligase [Candidatus Bathyarchaeota archaeon]